MRTIIPSISVEKSTTHFPPQGGTSSSLKGGRGVIPFIQIFFILLSFFISNNVTAQTAPDLAIGQWKEHLPFTAGLYVTQSDDQVFYSTAHALLIIDKADRALQRMTKVEGLSRVGVDLVKYNKGSEVLMVVFDDGAIDLLSEEGNLTLLGVPESSVILGEKKINDVFMANDSIAYISGNFGLTTLNVKRGLFPNTIRIPMDVRSAVVFNNAIYASTIDGIYTIDLGAGLNIDDFSNWGELDQSAGFPPIYDAGSMIVFNDKMYVDVEDSLYVFDGNAAEFVLHQEGFTISYLSADGPHLLAGMQCTDNCKGKVLSIETNHDYREIAGSCVSVPFYAVEDDNGSIWLADLSSGFKVEENQVGACNPIQVNSYRSVLGYDIAIDNGQVWVASGALDNTNTAISNIFGFSSFIEGEWTQYSLTNRPDLNGNAVFLDVEIHPQNGKIYGGAFWDALVEYDPESDTFEIFNETNSSLQLATGDPTRSRVAGLAFDRENNLWICNNEAPEPISVLKPDGSSESFDLDCTPGNGALRIVVDDFGYKWIMTNSGSQGVVVFDEGDIDVAVDNRCVVLNTSNSALPSNDISSIEVDLDGAIWVGTKLGAVVFQCDPFGECNGTRPFVEVDGFGANLLEDQNVTAIGVDGANRKWFGTETGVFVMSPEGNEQVAKFTEENSPLFDNHIFDIAFNHETGEVWIGTAKGLISYRGDATLGGSLHDSNVLVFPNPVRPDYNGPIAIKGLAQDATVKITDISGQLVYETEALGGQAIWDARDYNDRKVNTGVYLVFATSRNSSNPDVAVAKILVVN